MQFPNFDPVLISIGPVAIHWYALAYIAGILAGWRYAHYLVSRPELWAPRAAPLTKAQIDDLVLWITLGVILGGRIGYVLFYGRDGFWNDPLEIFKTWHGGMSFHGGLTGVIVAVIAFARVNKLDMVAIGDLVAPCAPFGLFFGRLANFINGELWGRVTHVPWGVIFCSPNLMKINGGVCPAGLEPRHPSQLYEAGLEGLVLFAILRLASHRFALLRRPGAVTGLFLVSYGAFRILLETVRNPDLNMPSFPLGLTMGMMLSIPMLLGGAAFLWYALRPADGGAAASEPPAA